MVHYLGSIICAKDAQIRHVTGIPFKGVVGVDVAYKILDSFHSNATFRSYSYAVEQSLRL